MADLKTPHSVEAGKVIRIVESFQVAHQDPSRKHETNNVEILHADGSVARYAHLSPNSAQFKLWQLVKTAEEIAKSGYTGFSTGAHLHLDVITPVDGKTFKTLPLRR